MQTAFASTKNEFRSARRHPDEAEGHDTRRDELGGFGCFARRLRSECSASSGAYATDGT